MHRLIARTVGKLSETLRSGRSFGTGGEVLQFDVRMCTREAGEGRQLELREVRGARMPVHD